MKKLILLFIFIGCSLGLTTSQNYTQYVDPLIGSGGHGHVFVGASVPFGAVQIGPSNIFKGWDWCSGYHYGDSLIIGFSQLHLSGTGIGDLNDVLIMPYTGSIRLDKGADENHTVGYGSLYSHQNETVKPGYYSVKLSDSNIKVELTASERVGYHQYTFPKGQNAHIIIDLKEGLNDQSIDTYIEQVDACTFKGYRSSSGWAKRQQVFFAIKTSQPIDDFSVYDEAKPLKGKKAKGKGIKGLISFDESPDILSLKVGISPISANNALANIENEIPHWDFNKVVQEADKKWNNELSKINVETESEKDKRIFYTSMYHTMIHPSLFNDYNNDYMGSDWKIHKKPSFENYTILSLWDTYRATHPLFTITHPTEVGNFINSMLAVFDETGALPIWHLRGYETGTMVGISSFQVIAEAYLKGCKGFDAEKAFHALKTTAMSDIRGLDYVRDFKAIPSDVMSNRPVAMALEYAIGDASIALMAKKMNKEDDYEYFKKRSENYKLYYDNESGFFRGKLSNGDWTTPFDPFKSIRPWASDYAEGNAWQYLWLVPHDIEGLMTLLGGKNVFIDRLDQFFSLENKQDSTVLVDLTGCIGQYAHGNEPSHHVAYMYTYAGQQWKTARLVRKIMREFYNDQPDGLIGNEDCGQMSAWYILSSLGFYPVFTASEQYVIGSPIFNKVTINLEGGKTFIIEVENNSDDNIYIQSVELNGKNYNHTFLIHENIVSGGHIKLVMGNKPNYEYGISLESLPKTLSGNEFLSNSFVHPGMAQNKQDLDYMCTMIKNGESQWMKAYENLKKITFLDFMPRPFTEISVGAYGTNSIGGKEFAESAEAVYNHAMIWYITKDKRYADKAIEILNAWSYKLRSFDANNAKLTVGLCGYYFLNAAEIIKHTSSGWLDKDIEQFERMLLTVFYPTIKDFFTEANGNWDASMISTMLCIGVFLDNHEIFNRAIERFYRGEGNSGITKYIYPSGQCQETTRDWDHVQLGIGEFAKAAQVAYTQGLDLYCTADDRLARGFEYTSKFMIGESIDLFGVFTDRRSNVFKDVYESIYHHYYNVKGISLPYTEKVILNHTRPASSIGFLSSVKAPTGFIFSLPLNNLTQQKYITPNETGALKSGGHRPTGESILVLPGESIQDAINSFRGSSGYVVLAKGIHIINEPLKLFSHLTLSGQGYETILFLASNQSTSTIISGEHDLHHVMIRDLLIEGAVNVIENEDPNHDRRTRSYMNAPSREGVILKTEEIGSMHNISFENITVQNFTKNGVSVVGATDVRVFNCDFSDNGSSVVPGAGFHHNLHFSYVDKAIIENSRFDASPWGNGIDLTFCQNVRIKNSEMARNKLSGVYCAQSCDIVIENNLMEGNDQRGISIETLMDENKNIKIQNNKVQNNGK